MRRAEEGKKEGRKEGFKEERTKEGGKGGVARRRSEQGVAYSGHHEQREMNGRSEYRLKAVLDGWNPIVGARARVKTRWERLRPSRARAVRDPPKCELMPGLDVKVDDTGSTWIDWYP